MGKASSYPSVETGARWIALAYPGFPSNCYSGPKYLAYTFIPATGWKHSSKTWRLSCAGPLPSVLQLCSLKLSSCKALAWGDGSARAGERAGDLRQCSIPVSRKVFVRSFPRGVVGNSGGQTVRPPDDDVAADASSAADGRKSGVDFFFSGVLSAGGSQRVLEFFRLRRLCRYPGAAGEL
jgi:hypothetical protein